MELESVEKSWNTPSEGILHSLLGKQSPTQSSHEPLSKVGQIGAGGKLALSSGGCDAAHCCLRGWQHSSGVRRCRRCLDRWRLHKIALQQSEAPT